MTSLDKIRAAVKYYRDNKDELRPIIERAELILRDLKKGRDVEVDEIITRYNTVAKMREARAGVEKEMADKMKMADAISFLGLIIKLAAKAIL